MQDTTRDETRKALDALRLHLRRDPTRYDGAWWTALGPLYEAAAMRLEDAVGDWPAVSRSLGPIRDSSREVALDPEAGDDAAALRRRLACARREMSRCMDPRRRRASTLVFSAAAEAAARCLAALGRAEREAQAEAARPVPHKPGRRKLTRPEESPEARLYAYLDNAPEATVMDAAEAVGMSPSWVKKHRAWKSHAARRRGAKAELLRADVQDA